jgi:hypothetical protein
MHGLANVKFIKALGSFETSPATYPATQRHISALHTPQRPVKCLLCNHLPPNVQLRRVFLVCDNLSTHYANGCSVIIIVIIVIVVAVF